MYSYIVLQEYESHYVELVVSYGVIDNDDFQVNYKIEYDDPLLWKDEQTYFRRIDRADRYSHDRIRVMVLIKSNHLKK